ncbi:hypothetical protein PT974_01208 [Cladobotryum mycophilum]|uniref:Band 7 domain-containing protein n=1 Tax=Cladobotryum mycophilum TaxID=491253 RepID=A0ABR0T467_9HYPO
MEKLPRSSPIPPEDATAMPKSPESVPQQPRTQQPQPDVASALPQRVQELRPSPRSPRRHRTRSRHGSDRKSRKHTELTTRRQSKRDLSFEERRSKATDETSFRRQVAVLTAVSKIPDLQWSAPQLVSSDPGTRTYIIRIPKLDFGGLQFRASSSDMSTGNVRYLKQELQSYVKQLYENGVAYKIIPEYTRHAIKTGKHILFLGGMMDSAYCRPSHRLNPEWAARESEQYTQIEMLFVPMEAAAIRRECDLLAEDARRAMECVKSLTENITAHYAEGLPTMQETEITIREASAAMKEAYTRITDAHDKMKEAGISIGEGNRAKMQLTTARMNAGCLSDAVKRAEQEHLALTRTIAITKPVEGGEEEKEKEEDKNAISIDTGPLAVKG